MIDYREVTQPDFATRAASDFVIDEHESGLLLRGTCPRCGEPMEVAVVDVVFKSGQILDSGATQPAGNRIEPIVCSCAHDHPGRPVDRTGCGAYWTFVIPEADA
ncbi:hypothetical protein E1264_26050 [Actinomadura sp. KC216]|uniref:hypothetical protein n=1 Tax=Actinomadura sp. KC216 TaxID=2530370 RepID=UPI00104A5FA1|nr:hypothetical protein [Actinomadura sp. KC216]TDB84048.1 hypothetical protein E1264_26050 [Actinomadura sp. KC216]